MELQLLAAWLWCALIAAIKGMGAVLEGGGLAAGADYLRILAVFDLLFLVGGLWLFGELFQD